MPPPGSTAATSSAPGAMWRWRSSKAKDGQRWNEIEGLGKCGKTQNYRQW